MIINYPINIHTNEQLSFTVFNPIPPRRWHCNQRKDNEMIKWIEEGKYGKIGGGYLKDLKAPLFEVHWAMSNKNDTRPSQNKYELFCYLPGFKRSLGNFLTYELAKERSADVLYSWMKKTGLIFES